MVAGAHGPPDPVRAAPSSARTTWGTLVAIEVTAAKSSQVAATLPTGLLLLAATSFDDARAPHGVGPDL